MARKEAIRDVVGKEGPGLSRECTLCCGSI